MTTARLISEFYSKDVHIPYYELSTPLLKPWTLSEHEGSGLK